MEWKPEREIAQELFEKGYKLQMEGKVEEAILNYQKSIEVYPTAEAHTFLGWSYSFQGRHSEAIEECKKAISIDPDFGNPYNDIGAYLIELGKYDEAVEWLMKATQAKRYESYCYPHYNLGRVYEKKGNWVKALEYYQLSLKENPDYTLAARAVNRLRGMLN